ncbi:hypothetical protein FNH04_05480 [Streptomyces phyllanthi]|uniref:DUF6777 domain-containing protein n=1 Tax=Streptomyces phyllanthi TaxID=1803180 RepID=A0A5N8VVU7_9ACTN|nr:hypothetical protein [Streptomyces phyllanthi]
MATAVIAAVVLAIVFSRSGGDGGSDNEVFLQAAASSGPDPFTGSTATDSSAPPATPTETRTPTQSANVTRGIDGSSPGLYGGTRNNSSCDVEKQITALRADPAKNGAFASAQGIRPSEVPAYLRSLTPLQLRFDTRVTNHGYRGGRATPYQAVLQAGTAVLVDDLGVPRVRCACGNPLRPPVPQKSTPKPTGDSWPSYRPQNVVVVSQSTTIINAFVVYDPDNGGWFERRAGDTGGGDRMTSPPTTQPSPSISVSDSPPASEQPSPCVTLSEGRTPSETEDGSPSLSPCPPTSPTPSPSEPSTPETSPTEPESPPTSPETETETETEPPPDSPTGDDTTTASGTVGSVPQTEPVAPGE